MIERGTIEQINARGRMTLRLRDRRVVADLHSGSGGSIGDLVEGNMRPGLQSWRNVGNSILSVVQVVAVHLVTDNDRSGDAGTSLRLRERAVQPPSRHTDPMADSVATPDQNSKRRFS